MKSVGKTVQKFAVLAAVLGAAFVSGCASLDQNMAASRKEHLVPGKQIHLTNMRGYRFCEVALITGTSKANAIADFYNSTGSDDCTPARFAGLDKDKIIKETDSRSAFLNPSRHWMMDEVWVYEDGVERTFGGIKFTWMGVVQVEQLEKGVTMGHYVPGYIYRDTQYKYNKGSEIYILDAPDGEVFVMQSFTNFVQKEVTIDNIKDLGRLLKMPPGWKFRAVVLDRDLVVNQKRANNLAHVFQDDLKNAYQGSDGGKAFSFIP
jgi:hypothetical protein